MKADGRYRLLVEPPPGRVFVDFTGNEVKNVSREFHLTTGPDLSAVILSTEPYEGQTKVGGATTATGTGGIALIRLRPDSEEVSTCLKEKDLAHFARRADGGETQRWELLALTPGPIVTPQQTGSFEATLTYELKAGDRIQAVQVLKDSDNPKAAQEQRCASAVKTVKADYNFYRTAVSFVAGLSSTVQRRELQAETFP